jgi:hypothetical protein
VQQRVPKERVAVQDKSMGNIKKTPPPSFPRTPLLVAAQRGNTPPPHTTPSGHFQHLSSGRRCHTIFTQCDTTIVASNLLDAHRHAEPAQRGRYWLDDRKKRVRVGSRIVTSSH